MNRTTTERISLSTPVGSEISDAGMFCSCSPWRLIRISSVAADREKISFRNREQDSQRIPPSRGLKCQRVAHRSRRSLPQRLQPSNKGSLLANLSTES